MRKKDNQFKKLLSKHTIKSIASLIRKTFYRMKKKNALLTNAFQKIDTKTQLEPSVYIFFLLFGKGFKLRFHSLSRYGINLS